MNWLLFAACCWPRCGCSWNPRLCHFNPSAALCFRRIAYVQDAALPVSSSGTVPVYSWRGWKFLLFGEDEDIQKNNFMCSSRKHTCGHWAPRRAVKCHELRSEVVSAVCVPSVCGSRKPVPQSSMPLMSLPPLLPGFLHTEGLVFKEQLDAHYQFYFHFASTSDAICLSIA